ncbi:hypothetical protein JCM8097_002394 [Rhodosporidiobolus ruineniae]
MASSGSPTGTAPASATLPPTSTSTTHPSPPTARPFHHSHSHSANTTHGLSASDNSRISSTLHPKYNSQRATLGAGAQLGGGAAQVGGGGGAGSASTNWRTNSPGAQGGRASTGGVGLPNLRPASELLGGSHGTSSQGFQSAETDAIDRWFEDLQQYEATLEDMAAASLDPNFKEELGAIEQWFRVLSEAERTAALYSLLQSSTQMQMRFFVTVLQQMARADPTQAALLSPANPGQASLEAQMEAKLAALGMDSHSPASPAVRQFARQSLGIGASSSTGAGNGDGSGLLSPNPQDGASSSAAQSTLASQRAKLKASARTSAPANLLLGASNGGGSLSEGLKSPLWSKEETLRERSPSPRPHSTGGANNNGSQSAQPNSSAAFLRSPALDNAFDGQLSPLVGGSWASMVNTPLVSMFGKDGSTMEQGNFGASVTSPNPNDASWRNNGNNTSVTSPNPNGGIVLDDVRKFRRSARVSGTPGGGLAGGALGGMYDSTASAQNGSSDRATSAATAQKRVQDQLNAVQGQLKSMLAGGSGIAPQPTSPSAGSFPSGAGVGGSRLTSSGALSSPGLQQTAMAAQQNWRNANAAHLPPPTSPSQNGGVGGYGQTFSGLAGGDAFAQPGGLGVSGLSSPNLGGGLPGGGNAAAVQAQAQAQLASLLALQQQMVQQQQQLQSLANGVGLNIGGMGGVGGGLNGLGVGGAGMGGMGMGNPGLGMGLSAGMMSPGLGAQLSPRLGGGNGGFGLGFGGMPSPRRSPRPHDRSPHLGSRPSADRTQSGNPQQTPGSGQNPDEPLDMALLGDTPAWLRSLRLHKYTTNFDGVSWRDMAVMDDKALEDKGVSALGARRKLLKVFEVVRAKTGIAGLDGVAASSPTSGNGDHHSNAASSPSVGGSPVVEQKAAAEGGEEA